MENKYKTVSCNLLTSNPYWDYKHDKYIMPSGNEGDYFYVETPGSIMVIPRTDDGKFIFVRQYRYLNGKYSLEFPGGGMKKGIDIIKNAEMELSQEAGLKSSQIIKIGEFNPFNGVTNEICNVLLAVELAETESNPDESEEFDIFKLSYDEVINLINSNEIWDGMTLSAWALYIFSNYRS